ncbi:hypothetical protein B6259_06820 [Ruminococcaceae bacterium CPB6]|nr:hypothetical protein B6259_06820 [Ruminococcaceae bacterium CPB6]
MWYKYRLCFKEKADSTNGGNLPFLFNYRSSFQTNLWQSAKECAIMINAQERCRFPRFVRGAEMLLSPASQKGKCNERAKNT